LFAAIGTSIGFLIGAPYGSAALVTITSTEGNFIHALVGAYAAEFVLIGAVVLYLKRALEEADRSPIPEKRAMVANSVIVAVPPFSYVAIAVGTLIGYNWPPLAQSENKRFLPNVKFTLFSAQF
jgi:hypothetical protein